MIIQLRCGRVSTGNMDYWLSNLLTKLTFATQTLVNILNIEFIKNLNFIIVLKLGINRPIILSNFNIKLFTDFFTENMFNLTTLNDVTA